MALFLLQDVFHATTARSFEKKHNSNVVRIRIQYLLLTDDILRYYN